MWICINMKRTREHEIESLSNQCLERRFVDWICNKLHNDYGLDYQIEITEGGKTTGVLFFIQIKGTDSLDISEDSINYSIEVKYLLYYLEIIEPVLFFRYDTKNDTMYWLNLQRYAREQLSKRNPEWKRQKTVTLKIPLIHKITNNNSLKDEVFNSRKENARFFINGLKWFEGNEKLLNDMNALEASISKQEKEINLERLYAAMIYYRENNLEKAHAHLINVYKQKSENVEHLQTILALITGENVLDENAQENIIALVAEGDQLAKKLHENIYSQIFEFYKNLIIFARLRKQTLPLIAFRINRQIKNIDEYLIAIYRNQLEITYTKQAYAIKRELNQTLDNLLSNQVYFEFVYLRLTLLLVENVNIYALLKGIEGKSEKKLILENLKQQEPYFDEFINLLERMKIQELLLYGLCHLGARFEFLNPEKAKSIYEKGL